MRTTTTLFASCLSVVLSAQAYRPFPEGNATWIEYHDGIVGSNGPGCFEVWAYFHRAIFFGADTTFDGHTYHILMAGDDGTQWCPQQMGWQAEYHNDPYPLIAIRQDTAERKVYGAWPWEERVLFDFSRDVGDTINFLFSEMIVDSIYMMPLADGDHRAFDLVCIGCGLTAPTTTMIEGIGATFTATRWWDIAPGFEYGANLECFTQELTTIFTDTIDGPPICDASIAMRTSPSPARTTLTVFPNPAGDHVTISLAQPTSGTMTIHDARGSVVQRSPWPAGSTSTQLDLHALESGIYLVELITPEGRNTARVVRMR